MERKFELPYIKQYKLDSRCVYGTRPKLITNPIEVQQPTKSIGLKQLALELFTMVHAQKGEEVSVLLKENPQLMLEKRSFTDKKNRVFSDISPFVYALWALKSYDMIEVMFKCLPINAMGKQIANSVKEQYYQSKEQGVTYRIGEETVTVKHLRFSALKESTFTFFGSQEPAKTKEYKYFLLRQDTSALPDNPKHHHSEPWSAFDVGLFLAMGVVCGNVLWNCSMKSYQEIMVVVAFVAIYATQLLCPNYQSEFATQFKKSGFLAIPSKLDALFENEEALGMTIS